MCGWLLESTVNDERPGPTSSTIPDVASMPEFQVPELVSYIHVYMRVALSWYASKCMSRFESTAICLYSAFEVDVLTPDGYAISLVIPPGDIRTISS